MGKVSALERTFAEHDLENSTPLVPSFKNTSETISPKNDLAQLLDKHVKATAERYAEDEKKAKKMGIQVHLAAIKNAGLYDDLLLDKGEQHRTLFIPLDRGMSKLKREELKQLNDPKVAMEYIRTHTAAGAIDAERLKRGDVTAEMMRPGVRGRIVAGNKYDEELDPEFQVKHPSDLFILETTPRFEGDEPVTVGLAKLKEFVRFGKASIFTMSKPLFSVYDDDQVRKKQEATAAPSDDEDYEDEFDE